MDRSIDIIIKKLLVPVEKLPIDKRARHRLKGASLYTVAEVLLAGKAGLVSAKKIGPLSADRIWKAVAGHLDMPEDRLPVVSPSPEEACLELEAWAVPISALELPQASLSALKSMGLYRVRDLVRARPTVYSKFLGMSLKEIDEIQAALSLYLAQAALRRLPEFGGPTDIPALPPPEPGAITIPDLSIPLPAIGKWDWSVLEYRAMKLYTMEQMRANFGFTSGKIRRTIVRVHDELQRKLVFLSLFLDHFEKKAVTLHKNLGIGPLDIETLTLHLLSDPTPPDLLLDEERLAKLIVLIRSMVLQPSSWFKLHMETRWPCFILLSCLVEPAVTSHKQVRRILRERKHEKKSKTNRQLAYLVLTQTGKPMHFSTIAEEVRLLGGQDSLKQSTLYSMLISNKDLFSRIGPGTYALAEWGIQTPEFYPVIIASMLSQADRPMPMDWIKEQVSAIRPIRSSTLIMYLKMHVRFYKSMQDTYGLRGWLPEDAEQLPLPAWLVETPTSLLRVGRARAQGIHVDKIISQDRRGPLETTTS